jgi:hypothetical protein
MPQGSTPTNQSNYVELDPRLAKQKKDFMNLTKYQTTYYNPNPNLTDEERSTIKSHQNYPNSNHQYINNEGQILTKGFGVNTSLLSHTKKKLTQTDIKGKIRKNFFGGISDRKEPPPLDSCGTCTCCRSLRNEELIRSMTDKQKDSNLMMMAQVDMIKKYVPHQKINKHKDPTQPIENYKNKLPGDNANEYLSINMTNAGNITAPGGEKLTDN